ncbi:MAG: hypothetical protein WBF48_05665 [Halarcobacter sp.]
MNTQGHIVHELQFANTFENFITIWLKYEDYFIENKANIVFTQDIFTNKDLPSIDMFKGYENRFKSLFKNNNLTFLNETIINAYKTGKKPEFKIDYTVSFDTQFVSYIEKYFTNIKFTDETEFEEILYNLTDNNVQSDYLPYMMENMSKQENKEGIKQNIEHVVKFFSLDKTSSILLKNMRVDSNEEYKNRLSPILHNIDNMTYSSMYEEFSFWQKVLYIILMKIVIINYEKNTVEEKINDLMQFMHYELNVIFARELVFAKEFFEKDTDIIFFNKVRNINKKTLSRLENMSWDFALMRFLERSLASRPIKEADFYISYFLTFDKGLSQLIDLYPIKAFIYFEKNNDYNIIPEIDIINFLEEYGLDEKYFNENAINYRASKCTRDILKYNDLQKQLESIILTKI